MTLLSEEVQEVKRILDLHSRIESVTNKIVDLFGTHESEIVELLDEMFTYRLDNISTDIETYELVCWWLYEHERKKKYNPPRQLPSRLIESYGYSEELQNKLFHDEKDFLDFIANDISKES